jgi:hypothetical protein
VYTNGEELPNVIFHIVAHFIVLLVELLQIHMYCVNINHAYCIFYKSNSNVGVRITQHSQAEKAGVAVTLREELGSNHKRDTSNPY